MISLTLLPRARAGRRVVARASFHVLFSCAAVAWIAFCSTAPVNAADRFWITTAGGAFAANANWSTTAGGAGGATPPAAADVANFTLTTPYTVNLAANVTNTGLLVANGSVTLDLGANTYTITGAQGTSIGTTLGQTGLLTLKNGTYGVDTAGDRILVGASLATGGLKISTGGRLGNGTIDPDALIGNAGTGTLTIEDNGRADLGFLNVGQDPTATGTVTVNGPNAVLDCSSVVNVGLYGTGALSVLNAGTMASAGVVRLGVILGANGSASVSNLGSSWSQASSLIVGDAGDGGLTVQSAGSLNTVGAVSFGNVTTGVGTGSVTGTESTWNMASTLQIGVSGLASLSVSAGGRANTAGTTTIAANAGSEGFMLVTGAGSRWTTGAVTVGSAGSGNLMINSAGVVNTTGNVILANAANALGKATVTGIGSAWNITGGLNIAAFGSGTLNVDSGASLAATGALTIGDPAGAAVGTLNFDGGTIAAGGFTRSGSGIFNWTDGTLLVSGGTLNNGGANLTINGADLSDAPVLRLSSGAQSVAANLPNLTIGANRQAAVVVSGGSNFQTTTASLGTVDTGNGSLHVEGFNSIFSTSGDLNVGGTAATSGGLGTVSIGPSGTIIASGTLRLWDGGKITLGGGTLRFNTLAANGGTVEFNSGTIQTSSTLNATAPILDALLGATHILGTGRKIDTQGSTMNLQSELNISGGAISGNTLAVNSGVILRVVSAGSAAFNSIMNPAGARMYVADSTVSSATSLTNGGELHLSGSAATVDATSLTNTGLVDGSGRINSVVTNNSAGQIRVAAGQRLEVLGFAGSNTNNGLDHVDGGTIEFGRSLTNSSVSPSTGLIAARDASLRFQSGLLNSGALTFTAGVSDVFGDVTNQNNLATLGRIIVTGGAQANFFDDVVNNGTIQVSAAGSLQSTAVFLGSLSGIGVSGGGHVFLEGDTRPGFSPGTMAFGGDVSFGPLSTLDVELAGTAPGTQYDRVTVAESAAVDGILKVSLLGGFKPTIGNSFQIVTAGGGLAGTFADEELPALAGGASWSVNYAAQSITLSVGGVLGDFNVDGRVDAADYTVWRNQLGSNSLAADASGNGSVDQVDYNIWKANFGAVAASGGASVGQAAAAVPEPSSAMLALIVALIAAAVVPTLRPMRSRHGSWSAAR
ncbi:MAG: dockerin type I domain-containing protein [Pirellulales bacterium]